MPLKRFPANVFSRFSILFCLISASSLVGCSSFQTDWEKAGLAAQGPQPSKSHPVLGRWEGFWRSNDSSHEGELRCIVTRVIDDPNDPENPPASKTDKPATPPKSGKSPTGATSPTAGHSQNNADGITGPYRFYFEAVWGLNFHSSYTVILNVNATKDGILLSGKHDLGWPIGFYKSNGRFDGTDLKSNYEAAGDHGIFNMHRPTPEKK